jgi:hypothetical protein
MWITKILIYLLKDTMKTSIILILGLAALLVVADVAIVGGIAVMEWSSAKAKSGIEIKSSFNSHYTVNGRPTTNHVANIDNETASAELAEAKVINNNLARRNAVLETSLEQFNQKLSNYIQQAETK